MRMRLVMVQICVLCNRWNRLRRGNFYIMIDRNISMIDVEERNFFRVIV